MATTLATTIPEDLVARLQQHEAAVRLIPARVLARRVA